MTIKNVPEAAAVLGARTAGSVLETKGSQVWSISPCATVYEAIALMDEVGAGALMVVAGDALVGVISERDYARKVILRDRSSRRTLVGEIMSSPAISVTPGHRIDECLAVMTNRRIRHLPVVEGGRISGVVSIGDLVNALISAQAETVQHLRSYIFGQYPA